MQRTVYVLVYPSRLFAAHWSFWLPDIDVNGRESDAGHRIHVTGDRLNGFEYEFVPNYNVKDDDRNPNRFPIGLLSIEHVVESSGSDPASLPNSSMETSSNAFDRACREVPAPGPSLNRVRTTEPANADGGPSKRTEAMDCQWWIKRAVKHLMETGVLFPLEKEDTGGSPERLVERLPRH